MARGKKAGRPSGEVATATTAAPSSSTTASLRQKQNSASDGGDASPVANATVRRYKDSRRRLAHQTGLTSASTAVSSADGLFVGPEEIDGLQDEQADVRNLDEPTMGSRLRGIRAAAVAAGEDDLSGEDDGRSDEEEEDDDDMEVGDDRIARKASGTKTKRAPLPPGSLSLGETLTQALHSNDTALLSSCLAHSDPTIIRLSVSRLSGPLAVRLLEHCIDRMAHGGRKSVGQLSSARARGIIEWVRATLTAHTGYLMSLPTLVQRLALLHSTLSARLASQERLLALNGRLELVLSQIELRTAYVSAQQASNVTGVRAKIRDGVQKNAKKTSKNTQGREWVETSSDEENKPRSKGRRQSGDVMAVDSDDEIGGPVRAAEEEGEIQDIALGHTPFQRSVSDAESDEDDDLSEEEEEEEEDDEEDDEDDDTTGLLDLEAESTDGDGEDEDDEEEDDDDDDD